MAVYASAAILEKILDRHERSGIAVQWNEADHLAAVFVVFCHFPKCVLVHIRIKGEVGAVKLV